MHIRSFANEIIDIGNVDLDIQIERTNRKRTIALQVKNNKLIIKTPRSVSKKTLVDLIKRKQRWINQRAILNFEEQNLKNRKWFNLDNSNLQSKLKKSPQIIGYVIEKNNINSLQEIFTNTKSFFNTFDGLTV